MKKLANYDQAYARGNLSTKVKMGLQNIHEVNIVYNFVDMWFHFHIRSTYFLRTRVW